jgi:hypothetical protein
MGVKSRSNYKGLNECIEEECICIFCKRKRERKNVCEAMPRVQEDGDLEGRTL